MIKGIESGNHIVITGDNGFSPYVNMSNPSAGMMRYNGTTQNIEAYDGTTWHILTTDRPTVDLTSSASAAIVWAMKKMAEETELQKMAHEHPAVHAAYEAFKRAGEQLKTTIILSKDEQSTS
jgi:hypothetical protein